MLSLLTPTSPGAHLSACGSTLRSPVELSLLCLKIKHHSKEGTKPTTKTLEVLIGSVIDQSVTAPNRKVESQFVRKKYINNHFTFFFTVFRCFFLNCFRTFHFKITLIFAFS